MRLRDDKAAGHTRNKFKRSVDLRRSMFINAVCLCASDGVWRAGYLNCLCCLPDKVPHRPSMPCRHAPEVPCATQCATKGVHLQKWQSVFGQV